MNEEFKSIQVCEVTCIGGGKIGIVTLDAESRLNALSLGMIRDLDSSLRAWSRDSEIICVVMRGSGERAFCAGGDVRNVQAAILANPDLRVNPDVLAFFKEEYSLDFLIHRFPKPVLAWGTGIVFGGGLGLFQGASHRVVTETSQLAMPEIKIGFFPDVGASWFLRRMPANSGLFLGLTGMSLNASVALLTGLADFAVSSSDWENLLRSLKGVKWTGDSAHDRAALSEILGLLDNRARGLLSAANVAGFSDEISDLISGDNLHEIVEKMMGNSSLRSMFLSGCPTSIALSWEIWNRTRDLSLADVFRLDLIVAMQCCRRNNFLEGVRAALIDKDRMPVWRPGSFDALSSEWIEGHFDLLWTDSEHPLRNLECSGMTKNFV
jgi:enoyl-CoA hydratase/carnithine racemase